MKEVQASSSLVMKSSPDRQVPVIDRNKVDPALLKAAEGMESVFLEQMYKAMRKTIPSSELSLESPASEIYRSMLDTELAQKSARQGGIGIADQLIAYWQSQAYTSRREEPQLVRPTDKAAESNQVTGAKEGPLHESKSLPDDQQTKYD